MQTSTLTPADLEKLGASLHHHRDRLRQAMDAKLAGQRQVSNETESGDMAEQIVEQDEALRNVAVEAPVLADIEHALAKLGAGTYGFSEASGEPIPLDRLTAVPWARRLVTEEEQREPRTPEHV